MNEKLHSKTLADVQPGGRVMLGNSNIASGLRNMLSDIEQLGAAPITVDTNLIRDAIAALSAQPSPGGQDALVTDAMVYAAEEAYANSKPDNLHESFCAAIAAALAARQPVGEPVCNVEGTWLWSKLMDWCKRMGAAPSNHDELFAIANEANALYTAPPAQAVDLGQLPRAVELLSNVSRTLVDWAADEQREAIGIVKALIDSQA